MNLRLRFFAALVIAAGAPACSNPAPEPAPFVVEVNGQPVTPPADAPEVTRLQQARELRVRGESGAALRVLEPLYASTDPTVCKPALALGGAIHGEHDALIEAEDLLKRALDGDDSWPGWSAAASDLGIVLLRCGDERNGLEWLDRAKRRAAKDGDAEGLIAVLENESAYFRVMQKDKERERADAEIARLRAGK